MKAKEFLRRVYLLHTELQIKREQIESIRESITNITAVLDKEKVSKTPDPSAMETAIVHIVQLEEEIRAGTVQLVAAQQEVAGMINRLRDLNTRMLMSKHYIGFKPWNTVVDEMDTTMKWVLNRHAQALREIDRMLENDERKSSKNGGQTCVHRN